MHDLSKANDLIDLMREGDMSDEDITGTLEEALENMKAKQSVSKTLAGLENLRNDFENDLFEFVFTEPDYETGKQQYINDLNTAIELLERSK